MFRLHTKLLDITPPHRVVQRRCGGRIANTLAMIGLIVVLWLGSATADAQVIVPPNLTPGSKYRLVFVTGPYFDNGPKDGTLDATSSIIADYNSFVTKVANKNSKLAALGTTWTAIASTASMDAMDNTSTVPGSDGLLGIPIYKLSGSSADGYGRVAGSYSDLWDGKISLKIDVTQDGNTIDNGFGVWTGTGTTGLAYVDTGGTSRPLGSSTLDARHGYADQSGSGWISSVTQDTTLSRRFYGMSGELTAVPEPSTLGLGFVLAVAGAAWSARRRNRKAEPSADTASF